MAYDDKKLLEIVNGQGYLLQQAVEQMVLTGVRQNTGQWNMVSTEHFWEHTNRGQSGYVDLIIEHASDAFVGVVECKRYPQETPWIFLCSNSEPVQMGRSSLYWAYKGKQFGNQMGFSEFVHRPISYLAKFCVVQGQAKEKPMLERVAGELLYSVEALAEQCSSLPNTPNRAAVFLPMIVTTAQLYVCMYDQEKVDPNSGTLELDQTRFEPVPFIRFHKVCTNAAIDLNSIERFSEIEERQSQTVMVVQASSLEQFLSNCQKLTYPRHAYQWPWNKAR